MDGPSVFSAKEKCPLFISLGNQGVVNNSWKQMIFAPFSIAIRTNLTAFSIFLSFSS
jgi:hypothetical protein